MGENQASAKQHPQAEFPRFENCSHSLSTLLSKKNNSKYFKIKAIEQVSLYSLDYTINHNENEDKNEKAIA